MGILGQLAQVGKGVAGSCTGSILGCSDIDGIGTVIDGFDATLEVLGGGKEFDMHVLSCEF